MDTSVFLHKGTGDKFKEIVDAIDYNRMVSIGDHPLPGEYVVTGPQSGGRGWDFYIGYVVQVRKQAGAFGSDMILLRHPDGTLMRHENQSFFRLDEYWTARAKSLFSEGITPDIEDYTLPYTLGKGEYPEVGGVIPANNRGPAPDNSPMMAITVSRADGTKTVEIC